MQSIFTYDHDPPRVSSPWRSASSGASGDIERTQSKRLSDLDKILDDVATVQFETSADLEIDKLEAEPQQGPTEYKVHLLLRPRRAYFATSNTRHASGSQHSKSHSNAPRQISETFEASSSPLSHSASTRQHRLEQLTTQLLWRLQQSSPFHASSANNVVLPTFPEANSESLEPRPLTRLLPGLEESNGALYEIGVSDDGSFVGLTKHEMHESLNNLQAMAACLGCSTEILRMIKVGEAECLDDPEAATLDTQTHRTESLWVGEAYIKPRLDGARLSKDDNGLLGEVNAADFGPAQDGHASNIPSSTQNQIRVTLAGATMSGKSSLLGTLSISTLDNGRGKSRLSLLKHRHEIASGMTSSVTQELVGYHSGGDTEDAEQSAEAVNYSTRDVSAWSDIHTLSRDGRLAFVSDSAGHPRYRRTIVRGLLGWAPHWTFLCMPASNSTDAPNLNLSVPQDSSQAAFLGASAHIAMAQLDLCIRLSLPLVIVITKLDAASKTSFRQILSTLLSTLKTAGRKPVMLANDTGPVDLQSIARPSARDITEAERVCELVRGEGSAVVPIVFTSAVTGVGIGKVHALLRSLPILAKTPSPAFASVDDNINPASIFHVDDVFKLAHTSTLTHDTGTDASKQGVILSGHLARGQIAVGEELLLGPFSAQIDRGQEENEEPPPSGPDDPFLTPRSFTDALAKVTAPPNRVGTSDSEWRRVRVVSLRNLRLPMQTLAADHVGTVGLMPLDDEAGEARLAVRRGMVLTKKLLDAAHSLTASFDISDASSLVVGNRVVIYSASVRSSAKVVAVALHSRGDEQQASDERTTNQTGEELTFAMDDEDSIQTSTSGAGPERILVTLQLDSYREWIEIGAKLLVMPGGGPGLHAGDRGTKGLAGLEGFVGQVMETFG